MKENSGIPPEILRVIDSFDDNETFETVKSVLNKIELDIKPTASVHHLVRQGGKMEDARQVLRAIIDGKLLIPVRNLETLEVEKFLPILEEDYPDDISSYLFFCSLQLIMNFLADKEILLDKFRYELKGLEKFKNQILDATIVHIDEPGKLRELIKNSPILSWFLTPASKICQATLALHRDHTAGLEMGNQDWSHLKRISGDSEESWFMYLDKRIRKEIQFGFEDWSKATDFLSRLIGLHELKAYMQYIGFPQGYGGLILQTLLLPQEVRSVVRYRIIPDDNLNEVFERIETEFHGFIHEGFMMGNQITKTVLHLTHVGQKALSLQYLKRKGINFLNQNKKPSHLREVPSNLRDVEHHSL
jgi:hypothetical protein